MKKKIVFLLVAALLITGFNTMSFAAGNGGSQGITPYWQNTSSVHAHLTILNETEGNLSVLINGDLGVTRISAVATLYYKNPSNRWLKTGIMWTYMEDDDYLAIDEDFTAEPGVEYKVILEAYVYANGTCDTITREIYS